MRPGGASNEFINMRAGFGTGTPCWCQLRLLKLPTSTSLRYNSVRPDEKVIIGDGHSSNDSIQARSVTSLGLTTVLHCAPWELGVVAS